MQTKTSLGDQCIQSEGLAQVKVELKQVAGYNRINIIDVLRHPDGFAEDGTERKNTITMQRNIVVYIVIEIRKKHLQGIQRNGCEMDVALILLNRSLQFVTVAFKYLN